ncbi:MAG: aminomethyl-transferring glycine dehydrogenase subunit GcvPA, partial [Thermoanaerobaculia bacterium]|nr:aminomethyl-transferring glycine dehydrogenase subunit GcvPA [Thermoanaerobaculia bacterium]
YIPNSEEDIRSMLETIGVESIEQLFESIPDAVKITNGLDLPESWSEIELRRWIADTAARNKTAAEASTFMGAGAYQHYQPACVDQLLLRSEFLTAYTPYQPEVSQGTLQAIYEYQTHQSLLTGLDVANASLYDGSTAFVEAVLMAARVAKKKNRLVASRSIHPEYLETLRTYIRNLDIELVLVGWSPETGRVDLDELRDAVDESTFAVAIQSPNFFGVIEQYDAIRDIADEVEALKIAVATEATSLGILSPPGAHGFDIACGEGQAWGIPPQFGGPYVGFLVAREDLKRHMPGRLAGETVDVDGKRAFVLTLATREQHIRRGKATSNICTNQALIALAANIYLSLMGKTGLREVGLQCLHKAAYLRENLASLDGVEIPLSGPVYNEFVVRTPKKAIWVLEEMANRDILAGVELSRYFEGHDNDFLVAVTELNTREQIDRYVDALKNVLV